MIKAVVFDLDDTLYLEGDYVKSGFLAVDEFLQQQGITGFFSDAWTYFKEGGRGNTFNVVLDQLSIDYDQSYVTKLINVYREHKPTISLLPDSLEIIDKLSGYYHLGLITDGFSVVQNNKVDALHLRELMDLVVVTDDLGIEGEYWKPHAKPYEAVQAYFSISQDSCVYVADNMKKDFVTANKLGWETVQIYRHDSEYSHIGQDLPREYWAGHKILTMNELPDIISSF